MILKDEYGQVWKDCVWNCVWCNLSNIDEWVNPMIIIVIPIGLRCVLRGHANDATTMVLC